MKKIMLTLFGLLLIYVSSSLSLNLSEDSTEFSKTIFVEIDKSSDASIFSPYSDAWKNSWNMVNIDLFSNGSELMNAESYKTTFDGNAENFWTYIHPKMLQGDLTLYSPFNPEMYGLSGFDHGELHYPIKGGAPTDNFLNSEEVRINMSHYFGNYGPQSDIPLVDEYGEPLIHTNADGSQSFVFPPSDFQWFTDQDIIKYKLRVKVLLKKNGQEKKRIIEAIAPIVNQYDGEKIAGERELFWIDYSEAKSILKKGYFINSDGKPTTYLNYFQNSVK